MKERPHALLYTLIALMVLCWSANYSIVKIALREFPPLLLCGLRISVAGLFMFPVFLWQDVGQAGSLPKRDLPVLLSLGLFGMSLNQLFFLLGLSRTSVVHSVLIISMTPIFVLLIAALMKQERITARKAAGMLIALAGVGILHALPSANATPAARPSLLGDLFVCMAALTFSWFTVMGKSITLRHSGITVTAFGYMGGASGARSDDDLPVAKLFLFRRERHWLGHRGSTGALPFLTTPDGKYHHLAMVYTGVYTSNGLFGVYMDGVLACSTIYTTGGAILGDSSNNICLGGTCDSLRVSGAIDEFRLSVGTMRSASWIATQYNNQNSPATFYSVGGQASGSGSQVVSPTFSPSAGTYSFGSDGDDQHKYIGASIRYTIDGSTPTSSVGTLYTGAITVGSTMTVKAIAYKSGMTDSSVASALYTIGSGGGSGADLNTYYTYNLLGTSATNPENGTVLYTYNSDNTLATKVDAKGQLSAYTYDFVKRVTQVQRYTGAFQPIRVKAGNSTPYVDAAGKVWAADYGYLNGTTYTTGAAVDPFIKNERVNNSGTLQYRFTVPNASYGISLTFAEVAGAQVNQRRFNVVINGANYGEIDVFQLAPGANRIFVPSITGVVAVNGRQIDIQLVPITGNPMIAAIDLPVFGRGGGHLPVDQPLLRRVGREGRPISLVDNYVVNGQASPRTWVTGVQYGPSNELTQISQLGMNTETRTYNTRGQLTRIQGTMDMEYRYSATQNNGQTTGPEWGQSYTYDGFGNRTGATVTKGSAPSSSFTVDATTNRIVGFSYDANGNMTYTQSTSLSYDIENRVATATGSGVEYYAYAPDNKRIWKKMPNGTEELYFRGISGQKLGTYRTTSGYVQEVDTNVYFGSRLIVSRGVTVARDRLGSNRTGGPRYFPYGEEQQVTAQDRDKFATYFRDGTTGLDYAQNRYYANTLGRFTSADPYKASGGPANPISWNQYSYVEGDPIDYRDPYGLDKSGADADTCVEVTDKVDPLRPKNIRIISAPTVEPIKITGALAIIRPQRRSVTT